MTLRNGGEGIVLHYAHLQRLYDLAAAQSVGGTNLPYASADVFDLDKATEIVDIGGLYTPGVDSIKIKRNGLYLVRILANYNDAGGTATRFSLHIGINDAGVAHFQDSAPIGGALSPSLEYINNLSINDIIDFRGGSENADTALIGGLNITVQQLPERI